MEKTFYTTKVEFVALTRAWKSKKEHTVAEHVIYNILRSKPADHGFEMKHKELFAQLGTAICWRAFNDAVDAAKSMVALMDERVYNSARSAEMNLAKKARFKTTFGIDIPEDLVGKFGGLKK